MSEFEAFSDADGYIEDYATDCVWVETKGGVWASSCGGDFVLDHPPLYCPSCLQRVIAKYMEVK